MIFRNIFPSESKFVKIKSSFFTMLWFYPGLKQIKTRSILYFPTINKKKDDNSLAPCFNLYMGRSIVYTPCHCLHGIVWSWMALILQLNFKDDPDSKLQQYSPRWESIYIRPYVQDTDLLEFSHATYLVRRYEAPQSSMIIPKFYLNPRLPD